MATCSVQLSPCPKVGTSRSVYFIFVLCGRSGQYSFQVASPLALAILGAGDWGRDCRTISCAKKKAHLGVVRDLRIESDTRR